MDCYLEEGTWIECELCDGTGEGEHDCGEDACCCLDPDPGVCDACGGDGGWEEESDIA